MDLNTCDIIVGAYREDYVSIFGESINADLVAVTADWHFIIIHLHQVSMHILFYFIENTSILAYIRWTDKLTDRMMEKST